VDRSLQQTIVLTRDRFFLAIRDAFAKLDPRVQLHNPVMFVVYLASTFLTIVGIAAALGAIRGAGHPAFLLWLAAWLRRSVVLANFAETIAAGRIRAQGSGTSGRIIVSGSWGDSYRSASLRGAQAALRRWK
jgi:K+-transporting ATPase ATPase B chain